MDHLSEAQRYYFTNKELHDIQGDVERAVHLSPTAPEAAAEIFNSLLQRHEKAKRWKQRETYALLNDALTNITELDLQVYPEAVNVFREARHQYRKNRYRHPNH